MNIWVPLKACNFFTYGAANSFSGRNVGYGISSTIFLDGGKE
jgi:hypothetical protein